MLSNEILQQLRQLTQGASREELAWISGYISGLLQQGQPPQAGLPASLQALQSPGTEKPAATVVKKITIVFGTETGNAKRVSMSFAAAAKKKGIQSKVIGLDQYKPTDLAREEYFFVVISTQGEGDPPVNAQKFVDFINTHDPHLTNMKYAVFALGDTSYPLFCKAGEDVDSRLHQLGAHRLLDIRKTDVDYEPVAEVWFDDVFQRLQQPTGKPEATSADLSVFNTLDQAFSGVSAATALQPKVASPKADHRKHYSGVIQANINLNDEGSAKQTYHIEIATDETVEYEPGDAFAIVPTNRPEVVKRILDLAGADGLQVVDLGKYQGTMVELLSTQLNVCYLQRKTIQQYAELTAQEIPDTRMDLVDLLRIYPLKEASQLEDVLRLLLPIAPRLYSIASSPEAHPGEIHLTVSRQSFQVMDEEKEGLCSSFLGDLPVGSTVYFRIHRNKNFRLPEENRDIIMIGPGTGIAPFRAFVAHRDATGATGRNWLFFGEQHFTTDFLYQTEWQQYLETGVLTHIHLAWSRDQEQKVYVQHRILEKGRELVDWIDSGASVYVCGAKRPMSEDVHAALVRIIQEQKGWDDERAQAYWMQLEEEGRYQKDVY